ncbi:transcription factor [Datura stramonium]|uniref:Transcription factor n=1 Tax=Datura stramonium TaxID=4076 RepID=A0ABS8SJC3_DATST|nr:transcription factor [Datura stramonium]
MDCVFTWDYNSLITELTQGMEHTKQLKTYLSSVASTSEATPELLLQKILSSYEQSLLIVKWNASASQSSQPLPPTGGAIEPRSPRGDDKKRSFKDHPELLDVTKRRYCRKSQPTWTEQVKVLYDDGYNWRKYGQKDILGARYPRNFYRCTYRPKQNCWATKQVQKLDDDPTVYEITYRGFHTCQNATNSALQPKSQEKQANNQTQIGGGYSPSIVSPTTTESSYFSVPGCQINSFGIVHNLHRSESYLSDIGIIQNLYHSDSDRTHTFSTNTSTTSSSIAGVDIQWAEFWQVKVG